MKSRRVTHFQVLKKHNSKAEQDFDLDFWLSLTPAQRIKAVFQAVEDYWKIRGVAPKRFRRILKVIK